MDGRIGVLIKIVMLPVEMAHKHLLENAIAPNHLGKVCLVRENHQRQEIVRKRHARVGLIDFGIMEKINYISIMHRS